MNTLVGIGEIISRSYHLYKQHFKILIEYVLLGFTVGAVAMIVQLAAIPIIIGSFLMAKYLGVILGLITIIIDLALFVIGLWVNFSFIRTVSSLTIGLVPEPIMDTFKKTRPVLWKGFSASVMSGLIMVWPLMATLSLYAIASYILQVMGIMSFALLLKIALVLLVLYSIIHFILYAVRLCFNTFHAVIYNTPAMKAIKTSAEIVRGRWWAIFGRIFVIGLIFIAGGNLLSGILSQIGTSVGGAINILMILLSMLVSVLVGPFMLLAMLILFHSAEKNLTNQPPISKV